MNNSRINKAIEQFKKIRMTTEEKSAMFERIIRIPQKPVVSPWTLYSFRSWIERNRLVALPVVIVLVLAISGTNIAFAAEGSLPGDFLYPVKTDVIEPIEGALAVTPVAKAKFNASIASTRLDEAETLASEGRLDPAKEQQIETSFNAHVSALSDELNVIAKTDASSSDALRTTFQADMNSHANILDIVGHRLNHNADFSFYSSSSTPAATSSASVIHGGRYDAHFGREASSSETSSTVSASTTNNFHPEHFNYRKTSSTQNGEATGTTPFIKNNGSSSLPSLPTSNQVNKSIRQTFGNSGDTHYEYDNMIYNVVQKH